MQPHLAPSLPVASLPLSEEQIRRLHLLGIRTLGELSALPKGALLSQFGLYNRALYQLAQGIDPRPVPDDYIPEPVQAMRQFEDPIADLSALSVALRAMADALAAQLESQGAATQELSLTIYLDDDRAPVVTRILQRPASSAARLHRNLERMLSNAQPAHAITGLEAIADGLVSATGQQLDLFAHTAERERLRGLLEDLRVRYGVDCFFRASLVEPATHLPERRFRLKEVGE